MGFIDRFRKSAPDVGEIVRAEVERAFRTKQAVTPLSEPRELPTPGKQRTDPRELPPVGEQFALAQLRPESPRAFGGRPYHLDEPWHFWVVQNPKHLPGKIIDVATIRTMADTYDPLRSCIAYLQNEVRNTPIDIVARDPDSKQNVDSDIAEFKEWLCDDGPLGFTSQSRSHFEAQMMEDALTVGAYAVWYQNSRVGKPNAAYVIDASTIRPRVDSMGWPDETIPFEQFIQGVQAAGFYPNELRYDGLYPRSYTPYFVSPIEWLIYLVTTALKADAWNGDWLMSGNTRKGDVFTLPESWSVEQIKDFAAYWDAKLAGHGAERSKSRFLPAGSEKIADHSRHEMDFQIFEEWLLRRTCSIMGVSPASIGHETKQYQVSQKGSQQQTRRVGAQRMLELRRDFYNDLLRRLDFPHLECIDTPDDTEEQKERAERFSKSIGIPWQSVNEGRNDAGLDPVEGGDVLLIPAGHVPIKDAEAQSAATVAVMEAQAAQMKASALAPQGDGDGDPDDDPDGHKAAGVDPGDVEELGLNEAIERVQDSQRFITIKDEAHPDGKRVIPISDRPVGAAHIVKATTKFGANEHWADMVKKAHDQGQIKTDRHLFGIIGHLKQHVKGGDSVDKVKQVFDAAMRLHGHSPEAPATTPKAGDKGTKDAPKAAPAPTDEVNTDDLTGTIDDLLAGKITLDDIPALTEDQIVALSDADLLRLMPFYGNLNATLEQRGKDITGRRNALASMMRPGDFVDTTTGSLIESDGKLAVDYYIEGVESNIETVEGYLSQGAERSKSYKRTNDYRYYTERLERLRKNIAEAKDVKANYRAMLDEWNVEAESLLKLQELTKAIRYGLDDTQAGRLGSASYTFRQEITKRMDDQSGTMPKMMAKDIKARVKGGAEDDIPDVYFNSSVLPIPAVNRNYEHFGGAIQARVYDRAGINTAELHAAHRDRQSGIEKARESLVGPMAKVAAEVSNVVSSEAAYTGLAHVLTRSGDIPSGMKPTELEDYKGNPIELGMNQADAIEKIRDHLLGRGKGDPMTHSEKRNAVAASGLPIRSYNLDTIKDLVAKYGPDEFLKTAAIVSGVGDLTSGPAPSSATAPENIANSYVNTDATFGYHAPYKVALRDALTERHGRYDIKKSEGWNAKLTARQERYGKRSAKEVRARLTQQINDAMSIFPPYMRDTIERNLIGISTGDSGGVFKERGPGNWLIVTDVNYSSTTMHELTHAAERSSAIGGKHDHADLAVQYRDQRGEESGRPTAIPIGNASPKYAGSGSRVKVIPDSFTNVYAGRDYGRMDGRGVEVNTIGVEEAIGAEPGHDIALQHYVLGKLWKRS